MKQNTKSTLTYSVRTETTKGYDDKYLHLFVEVWPGMPGSGEVGLILTWQANAEPTSGETVGFQPDASGWYAGEMTVTTRDARDIKTFSKLAERLVNDVIDPRKIGARLRKLGAVQVVYDQRLSKYLPTTEVPARNLSRWIDDYKLTGRAYCLVSTMAENEKEAKANLAAEISRISDNGYAKDYLPRWASAGQPVIRANEEAPVWLTLAEAGHFALLEERDARDRAEHEAKEIERVKALEAERKAEDAYYANLSPATIGPDTDLSRFDEYEAKERGWSNERISDALREIRRRELAPNLPVVEEVQS